MRSSKLFFAAVGATLIAATGAMAAHVDFNDPRRALGREGDVRIDAQLAQDTLSPNAPVTVTFRSKISRARPLPSLTKSSTPTSTPKRAPSPFRLAQKCRPERTCRIW